MCDSSTVLYRYPGSLSLPTADPAALAVETMLRVGNVRYTRRDAPMRALHLAIPDATHNGANEKGDRSRSKWTEVSGVKACIAHIAADTKSVAHQGNRHSESMTTAVEALCVDRLFPAFTFLVHYDAGVYDHSIKKSVVPKVGSLWESLRGTFCRHLLEVNSLRYRDGTDLLAAGFPQSKAMSAAQQKVLGAVVEVATEALIALEGLRVSTEMGFLGASQPGVVDAYAYAAASVFLHSDFGGSNTLPLVQKKMRESCPALVVYAGKMRAAFYEEFSGTYALRPVTPSAMALEEETMAEKYAAGRLRTLVWTGLFCVLYFSVVNADILAAYMAESDEEDEGTSGEHTEEVGNAQ